MTFTFIDKEKYDIEVRALFDYIKSRNLTVLEWTLLLGEAKSYLETKWIKEVKDEK